MLRRDLILRLTAITRDIVTSGGRHLRELLSSIARLFSDQDSPVVFSTIHKAKGKEADRVFILYPESMPAIYARMYRQRGARGGLCAVRGPDPLEMRPDLRPVTTNITILSFIFP